jgi:hypothetical protein
MSLIKTWFKENNIIITATDKNLGIAIISIADYHSKIKSMLKDDTTYSQNHFDPDDVREVARTNFQELFKSISRWITQQEIDFLVHAFDNHYSFPQFHILPKVHKDIWVGRPIVGNTAWITRNLAIIANSYLQKISELIPTILRDSKQYIQHLDGFKMEPHWNFFSLDAISMYTKLPVNLIISELKQINIPNHIIDILLFCEKHSFIQYGGQILYQHSGLAMGINYAVAFANLGVFLLIELNPKLLKFRKYIQYWGRYIDDINGIWSGTKEEYLEFFMILNTISPDIQWTNGGFNRRMLSLDVIAYVDEDNFVRFEMYQKPMNRYQYLPFNSAHSVKVKLGWIKGELIRYTRNCSCIEKFDEIKTKFYNRLRKRGYKEDFILFVFADFYYGRRSEYLKLEPLTNMEPFDTFVKLKEETKINYAFLMTLRTTFTSFASSKYPIMQDQILKKLAVLSTPYSSYSPMLNLPKILIALLPPSINRNAKIPITPLVAYKVSNKLKNIFTHKAHNEKLEQYFISLDPNAEQSRELQLLHRTNDYPETSETSPNLT